MNCKLNASIQAATEKLAEINESFERSTINRPGMKEQVVKLISALRRALYPEIFGAELTDRRFLATAISANLSEAAMLLHELICAVIPNACEDEAGRLVCAFIGSISETAELLSTDVRAAYDGDPAAKSEEEIMLAYPSFEAVSIYRLAHSLYRLKVPLLPRMMTEYAHQLTGIDIHPGATIGKWFFIDHGTGVVIGETTVIGDDVTIYQGVTLGGTGKHTGKRHPTIGNNVMIGAGAKVLGPLNIGDNSKIASGAVVLNDIPANSTAVGVPARVVKRDGIKLDDLDQIHIPDPVAQEIARLENQITELRNQLNQEENK